jgi:glycosyltransferase involved in cell wall biosynthesis
VDFLGHVGGADLNVLIAQSRFTIMPSHAYETFGKTILESYAQARAVVASDRGSRRELVHDGETGLLYRCGDVDQLSQCIEFLAADSALAHEMGLSSWKLTQHAYSPENHYEKLLDRYETLRAATAKLNRGPMSILRKSRKKLKWRATSLPILSAVSSGGKRKLRIAFIGGRGVISKYSGIETYYEEVGKWLVEMGHEVTVYCRSYFTPALEEHNGMRLVRFPTIRSKHLETFVHTLFSTIHAVTQRYDTVHYHALGPALFSFLPRLVGTKTAVTVQGLDWRRKKWGRLASSVLHLGEKASARFPNGTMVVSQALQRYYREAYGIEARYVPNGGLLRERTEARQILKWDLEPGKYVLFLGRFSPEKGCHLLIEAFEQIETDVKLVMAGASSYCDAYSRELRTHASERIRILDWVSGEVLDELLTNAMIFVLPSDLEGLSLALLDAMGAGLCVLTSDVPENREVVDGAGFTFERGNTADLAERMKFLIANPGLREAAGRTARKRIEEKYQWQKIATDIEKVYYEILGWPVDHSSERKPTLASVAAAGDGTAERRAV